jgi:putative hydrolase of the HAD superfamily
MVNAIQCLLLFAVQRILREKTASVFSDGKTSFDYRRERFAALLAHFSIAFMAQLLQFYEITLTACLEPKSGALGLLSTCKKLGKKTVVITEGPQDAQGRSILRSYTPFVSETPGCVYQISLTNTRFCKINSIVHTSGNPRMWTNN